MRVAKLWSEFEGPRRQDKSAFAYKRPLKRAFHFIVLGRWRWCRSNGYSRWGGATGAVTSVGFVAGGRCSRSRRRRSSFAI
jgi:hypothetical protein